jgi:C-terminal processing protease CtpA/Prc
VRKHTIVLLLLCLIITGCTPTVNDINGSFESITDNKLPKGWIIGLAPGESTKDVIGLDSTFAQNGRYSLSIAGTKRQGKAGILSYTIPRTYEGSEIELKGYIKTENVEEGFAGLWLRIDGKEESLAFNNMQNVNLKGTTNWKEYSIKLPYNSMSARSISLGGLLVGGGKMWMDNLRLYLDGKTIGQSRLKKAVLTKVERDTAFKNNSTIDTIIIDKQRTTNLSMLCQVWGFIKYHHKAVADGNFNMDAELFRIMPKVITAKNNKTLSNLMEKWIDSFGEFPICFNCKPDSNNVAQYPEYGDLFNKEILESSLISKLTKILKARNVSSNYYVKMKDNAHNPIFTNEESYSIMDYPDAGYRLLCLFRYWNIIQYFYPYKHLTEKKWGHVLTEYIPKFITASNSISYAMTSLKLTAEIHDTHANTLSYNGAIEKYRGMFILPVSTKFIDDKMVVTGYYEQTSNETKKQLQIGDIIVKINGESVQKLVKKFLPVTPASNYSTQLRDLPAEYLLRSSESNINIEYSTNKTKKQVSASTIKYKEFISNKHVSYSLRGPAFKLIEKNIGYVDAGQYNNQDLSSIKNLFKGTKGIVVDMRAYPSDFMIYSFVREFTSGNNAFAIITSTSVNFPGLFKFENPLFNKGSGSYNGRIVVLVNEDTQSQGEFTTMALQSSANTLVVGSTTAGADGNVSTIILPGGIRTMISGIGVSYPSGRDSQRTGIKIDQIVTPTIESIKSGEDLLLSKAIELIKLRKSE